MNILSNRIVDLVGKGIIGRRIIFTVFLLLFAGAQNISAEPVPTIVGGEEVNPRFKYTWMVALINSTAPPTGDVWADQFCGGTLIEPDLVVTAAHCVDDKSAGEVDVLLGAHDLTDGTENCNMGGECLRQRIKVSQLTIHEKWDDTTIDNDIALLKLAKPVAGLSAAALISLPALKDPGTTATAIGWGDTAGGAEDQDYPTTLQQVNLSLVSQSVCVDAHSYMTITDNMLCGWNSGKGVCFGDSGGPLVVQNASQNNRWELIGISSFVGPKTGGLKCAQPDYPSVFVNVYNYLDWIEPPSLAGAGVLLLLLDD